jgi:hypothetical protein
MTKYVGGAENERMKSKFAIALTRAALALAAGSHRGDTSVSLASP